MTHPTLAELELAVAQARAALDEARTRVAITRTALDQAKTELLRARTGWACGTVLEGCATRYRGHPPVAVTVVTRYTLVGFVPGGFLVETLAENGEPRRTGPRFMGEERWAALRVAEPAPGVHEKNGKKDLTGSDAPPTLQPSGR